MIKIVLEEIHREILWNVSAIQVEQGRLSRRPFWFLYLFSLVGVVKALAQCQACRFLGHRWVSDDYANEESGYMGFHCERCGESHGTYLY